MPFPYDFPFFFEPPWYLYPSDTLAISDSLAKDVGKPLSDNVSLTDDLMKAIEKYLSESFSIRETQGGFSKMLQITLDHTKVTTLLTDYPAMVYLSAASGQNPDDVSCVFDELQADANRLKIRITTTDGTECYVEVDQWDDANEKAWLHVKVPSISSSEDTVLLLYYDSLAADNTTYVGDTNSSAAENVWDSDFKAVYHMSDGADNAHIYDSTSNNNDGTKKGCLPKGTSIRTRRGSKDITDIEPGDEVLTYGEDGIVANRVLRTIASGVKTVYELKTPNRTIRASSNHPFLTACFTDKKREAGYNVEAKHPFSYLKNSYKLQWTPLAELSRGDSIVTHIGGVDGEITGDSDHSLAFMKLLGCYLGDGSNTTRKNREHGGQIALHLHDKELIAKYSDILDEEKIPHTQNDKVITICRNAEYDKLCGLGLVGNAHNKTIPGWVYSQSSKHKEALIEGLIDSDGYVIKYGFGIDLCNEGLIREIRNLCIGLGWRVSNVREKTQRPHAYQGRVIGSGKAWLFTFYPDSVKHNSAKRFNLNGQKKRLEVSLPKGFQFQTVTSIEEVGSEETYDLEIENTHNFIADDVVVHNSNEPNQVAGQVGYAQDFDGANDYVDCGSDAAILSSHAGTLEIVANWNTQTSGFITASDKDTYYVDEMIFGVSSANDQVYFYNRQSGVHSYYGRTPTNSLPASQYNYAVFLSNGSTIAVYINGTIQALSFTNGSNNGDWFGDVPNLDNLTLGATRRNTGAVTFMKGPQCEARISSIDRSSAWIATTYYSLWDDFCTFGAEEELGVVKDVGKFLSEAALAIADSISKEPGLGKSETFTLTDLGIVKDVGKFETEAFGLTDAGLVKDIGKPKVDTLAIADSLTKHFGTPKADSITITDTLTKAVGIIKDETFALADSVVKDIGLGKAENLTITDALVKDISIALADAIAIVDSMVMTGSYDRPGIKVAAFLFKRAITAMLYDRDINAKSRREF